MYALALSCILFAAFLALAEPIPVIHDRLIRRCDNHTSSSSMPYYFPGPTATPLSTINTSSASSAATSLNSSTPAGAVGTSSASASPTAPYFPSTPSSGTVPTSPNTSATVGAGSNTTSESNSIALSTTNISSTIIQTINITSTVTPPSTCYGYGCPPTYRNSTALSSVLESTTAGGISTSNGSTPSAVITAPATTVTWMLNSTALETSASYNSSSPESSFSYNTSTTADSASSPLVTSSPAAATSPASTEFSGVDQSSSSADASTSSQPNITRSGIWGDWTRPAQSSGAMPTTSATSLASINSTGPSPTGELNSTSTLADVKAEVAALAGDSVGLIEKIDSLLASLGGKKRRASKLHV